MNTKEKVVSILRNIKQTKDLTKVTDIVEGGYIDSYELMLLISTLSDEFKIEIDVDDIIPENFNSVDCIAKMVDRLKK